MSEPELSRRQTRRLGAQAAVLRRALGPLRGPWRVPVAAGGPPAPPEPTASAGDAAPARTRFLDLGTEHGHTGRQVRTLWPDAEVVGVEVHAPTHAECLRLNGDRYDRLVLGDALDFLRGDPDGDWDAVVAAELVEHLSKGRGEELLTRIEDLGARVAIVTSPLGYMAQGHLHGNPHQVHLSGWLPEEFVRRGWKVELMDTAVSLGVYSKERAR